MNKSTLLALSVTVCLSTISVAQTPSPAPAEPGRKFINKASFYLPINFDERQRQAIREVQLFIKDAPNKPWVLHDRVPPTQTFFAFQAGRDAEYSFMVVTVDQAGRTNPSAIDTAPPAMTIVLDTQPPHVEITHLPVTPEGQNIKCQIRDPNLDPSKTRFFYQTGDMVWRPLEPPASKPETYCIPSQALHTGLIRVLASDMAGNACPPIEINVSSLALGPYRSAPTAGLPEPIIVVEQTPVKVVEPAPAITTQGPALPPKTPVDPGSAITMQGPALPQKTNDVKIVPVPDPKSGPELLPASVNQSATPSVIQQMSHLIPNSEPTTVTAVKGEVKVETSLLTWQIVNTTRIYLEYQVEAAGTSGVGKVEVWITRDKGQTWQRYGEDGDRQSPAEINLPGEGLFGITLVLTNGRGFGATPPQPGEAPDHWIEVDITNPRAELLSVRPTYGDEGGTLLIAWTARDKNLATEPIDLYHAPSLEGPWTPIARNLRNEGTYRWVTPLDLGHAYVRLVARDVAGNACQVHTAQRVAADDLSRPRGRVLNISTTPPGASKQ